MSDHDPDSSPAPRPAGSSRPRHIRHLDDDWRAAAARATREGYGVAELVRGLVAAYGAGEIDPTRPPGQDPLTRQEQQKNKSSHRPPTHHDTTEDHR